MGDCIIDITADQFEGVNDKVIVSSDSEWHSKWRIIETHNPIDPENAGSYPHATWEFIKQEARRFT